MRRRQQHVTQQQQLVRPPRRQQRAVHGQQKRHSITRAIRLIMVAEVIMGIATAMMMIIQTLVDLLVEQQQQLGVHQRHPRRVDLIHSCQVCQDFYRAMLVS